jgi:chemotaxis signal transduction protein
LEDLAEIYHIDEITHLPLSPNFLVGVINVHGNLASVISLSEVLSITDAKESQLVLLLVPEKGGFAIQVDRTIGFGSYDVLEEVTRDAARRRGKVSFIEGVFRDGEDLYSLISTEKLRIWIDGEFTKGED